MRASCTNSARWTRTNPSGANRASSAARLSSITHSRPAWRHVEYLSAATKRGISAGSSTRNTSPFQNFRIGRAYFESRARDLQTPVMVIWGRQDRFINVELAHEIAETLPNTELEVVDQSGHYVHIDKPQELARAVTKFLYEPA